MYIPDIEIALAMWLDEGPQPQSPIVLSTKMPQLHEVLVVPQRPVVMDIYMT